MLPKRLPNLSADSESALASHTQLVLAQAGRRARYKIAKQLFSAKAPAATFREIRISLDSRSSLGMCYYCERDRYRDIDHVLPQSVYPELSFRWDNYVYSCVVCNQNNKKHRCAVVNERCITHDCTSYYKGDEELPGGMPCIINPRTENPFEYFNFDLDSGMMLVVDDKGSVRWARANYTIEVLDLNSDFLSRSRRAAYSSFRSGLSRLRGAIECGRDVHDIEEIVNDFRGVPHASVLVQMVRDAALYPEFREDLNISRAYVDNFILNEIRYQA